jgi:hypothetical protein
LYAEVICFRKLGAVGVANLVESLDLRLIFGDETIHLKQLLFRLVQFDAPFSVTILPRNFLLMGDLAQDQEEQFRRRLSRSRDDHAFVPPAQLGVQGLNGVGNRYERGGADVRL